jgi:hypothetical protein
MNAVAAEEQRHGNRESRQAWNVDFRFPLNDRTPAEQRLSLLKCLRSHKLRCYLSARHLRKAKTDSRGPNGASHPGGMPAINRGWRTAPPPDDVPGIDIPIPARCDGATARREGSQPVGTIRRRPRLAARWHPSRMPIVFREIRWCRSCLAPPPANGCQAFGLGGAARQRLPGEKNRGGRRPSLSRTILS